MVSSFRALFLAMLFVLALPTDGSSADGTATGLFVEARAAPTAPYVQQEVLLTVTLYRSSSLSTGLFLTPEIPDAVVVPLGETDPAEVIRNGRSMQKLEATFAIYPQSSGPLTVPAPVFTGRSAFARGTPLSLSVRPRPDETGNGWWLPARAITLEETWSGIPDPLPAGVPFERVVTLTAEGLTGAQLPSLMPPDTPGFRIRRVSVETEDDTTPDGVVGKRTEHHRLIPEKSGTAILPGLKISWWNTSTDGLREARISGRTFAVSGKTAASPAPIAPRPTAIRSLVPERKSQAMDILAAALVMLLLVSAFWLADHLIGSSAWRRRRTERTALAELKRACRRNDPKTARRALTAIAAARFPSTRGRLCTLAHRIGGGDAVHALRELDTALYGPDRSNAWDGKAFARAVLPALGTMREPGTTMKAQALPPLAP